MLQNIPGDTVYKNTITPVYTSKLPQTEYVEKQPLVTGNAKKKAPRAAEAVL
ncbi:TPA: hypothetical protein OUE56_004730 [Citrobacter sedlakii]|nr:hypothetical protein [Citrobacter sedlakii]HCU0297746.1 hypothetical protein [Citrobacter sedlakii]